jgi:AbrB family looped-hinge helix DNA binding protein
MDDTFEVEVGERGRVVIPSHIRRALDLRKGTKLVATVRNGTVVLAPREAAIAELRQMFADVDRSLADELMAERHAEAHTLLRDEA